MLLNLRTCGTERHCHMTRGLYQTRSLLNETDTGVIHGRK